MSKYKFCLCIGRFQPFHWGHLDLVQIALRQGEQVIMLLGSHLDEPSLKNPWSAKERKEMIRDCFTLDEQPRIQFIPIEDQDTDRQWVNTIYQKAEAIAPAHDRIAIVGNPNRKAFWAEYCPHWHYVEKKRRPDINATEIRRLYFQKMPETTFLSKLPPSIGQYLRDFKNGPVYKQLCEG